MNKYIFGRLMIYFEIQLDGRVRVFDMNDKIYLHRAQIEAAAEAERIPHTLTMAQDYIRARCHQFESFEDLDAAQAWADRYGGFRAGEVRASFGRFLTRRAERFLADETNNADCGQNHNERTVAYG
jgi:hypothetical protein